MSPDARAFRLARYSRQTRLAEVGEAGQARIEAHAFVVPARGLEAEVCARYLAGAGARRLVVATEAAAGAARAVDAGVAVAVEAGVVGDAGDARGADDGLADASAAAVFAGARRALRALRAALDDARAT